jgi:hypothetical protein
VSDNSSAAEQNFAKKTILDPGTDVMILKISSPKKFGAFSPKLLLFSITTLVFCEICNANFFAENWQNRRKF